MLDTKNIYPNGKVINGHDDDHDELRRWKQNQLDKYAALKAGDYQTWCRLDNRNPDELANRKTFDDARKLYEQAEQEQHPPRRFRSRAECRDLPAPKWLIDGLIPENADVVLVAPYAALKTFLATELAFAVATGKLALGQYEVSPGPVFYFCGEGWHSLVTKRAEAWELCHGYEPNEAPDIYVADGCPVTSSNELIDSDIAEMEAIAGPGRTKLFIIDTLRRAIDGPEDSSEIANRYLQAIKRIRDRVGGTSLTVAHTGKAAERGIRGSSAFAAGFDTILVIEKHAKDEETGVHTIQVHVEKQKDAEDGQRFWLQSELVSTQHGDTLVLTPCTEEEGKAGLSASGNSDGKHPLNAEDVRAALRYLAYDGERVSQNELIQKLVQMTGKAERYIRNFLNKNNKTGGCLYRYRIGDGRVVEYALPPDEQRKESIMEGLGL